MTRLLFGGTIFSSAFLLFLVQPLISKQILPWFGGSAAVWATCLVFFQVVLLAGYAYSDWISRHLSPRRQALVHGALLAISLALLPILPDAALKPTGNEDPALRILLLLTATIGLPYFLLSTTGPLLQSWVARAAAGTRVYRYFSLSNLASLLALICYPFILEPAAPLALQALAWSVVYALFALLCVACAVLFARQATPAADAVTVPLTAALTDIDAADDAKPPTIFISLLWLGLSAMGSWLLVAITNHITQNIAAVPFLWLLPLTIYLFTFVLCFESDRWYIRSRFLLPGAALLAACAYGLQDGKLGIEIKTAIPLYAAGLFFFCMFLHGEVARLRPAPRYLTRFYLMLALGGALGGIAVGLAAPRILPAYYELGIGFVITAVLAAIVLRGRKPLAGGALAVGAVCAWFLGMQITRDSEGARRMERSFYGSLRVVDTLDFNPSDSVRALYHGAIRHGEQYLDPANRDIPTTYYSETSGVGRALESLEEKDIHVGVVGLGAGTLATYGREGDQYRFYEINPQVIDLARTEFSFLGDSEAHIEVIQGDARLALENEAPQQFDVLAIDAFSGDSIPVHLITREAMAVYLRHLKPEGMLAFHVTNKFLALAPVVERLATERGLSSVLISDRSLGTTPYKTDWVLVARNADTLERGSIPEVSRPLPPTTDLATWTDDFNNLFNVLK